MFKFCISHKSAFMQILSIEHMQIFDTLLFSLSQIQPSKGMNQVFIKKKLKFIRARSNLFDIYKQNIKKNLVKIRCNIKVQNYGLWFLHIFNIAVLPMSIGPLAKDQ